MTLFEFMTLNARDRQWLATELSVSPEAVRLWLGGERTPSPEMMRRIAKLTKGKVTPNDFVLRPDLAKEG
jgi:DNA-binding transcriptional regulator YdaS (Cro superfamily)